MCVQRDHVCVRVCVCVCNVRVFVYIICAFAYWRESGLNIVSKETQYSVKRHLIKCQKRPNMICAFAYWRESGLMHIHAQATWSRRGMGLRAWGSGLPAV